MALRSSTYGGMLSRKQARARTIYQNHASSKQEGRPSLTACLKALRIGDTLMVWKLETSVATLCDELRITRATLYRYVGPNGELRERDRRVLGVDS